MFISIFKILLIQLVSCVITKDDMNDPTANTSTVKVDKNLSFVKKETFNDDDSVIFIIDTPESRSAAIMDMINNLSKAKTEQEKPKSQPKFTLVKRSSQDFVRWVLPKDYQPPEKQKPIVETPEIKEILRKYGFYPYETESKDKTPSVTRKFIPQERMQKVLSNKK
jgi:hypothetical protein